MHSENNNYDMYYYMIDSYDYLQKHSRQRKKLKISTKFM